MISECSSSYRSLNSSSDGCVKVLFSYSETVVDATDSVSVGGSSVDGPGSVRSTVFSFFFDCFLLGVRASFFVSSMSSVVDCFPRIRLLRRICISVISSVSASLSFSPYLLPWSIFKLLVVDVWVCCIRLQSGE